MPVKITQTVYNSIEETGRCRGDVVQPRLRARYRVQYEFMVIRRCYFVFIPSDSMSDFSNTSAVTAKDNPVLTSIIEAN